VQGKTGRSHLLTATVLEIGRQQELAPTNILSWNKIPVMPFYATKSLRISYY